MNNPRYLSNLLPYGSLVDSLLCGMWLSHPTVTFLHMTLLWVPLLSIQEHPLTALVNPRYLLVLNLWIKLPSGFKNYRIGQMRNESNGKPTAKPSNKRWFSMVCAMNDWIHRKSEFPVQQSNYAISFLYLTNPSAKGIQKTLHLA